MPKVYFIIQRMINTPISQTVCIVEDEDIAIDFCNKHGKQYFYTREEVGGDEIWHDCYSLD